MTDAAWPPGVREYLGTRDQFTRAELTRDDPALISRLASREALTAVGQWLAEDRAVDPANATLTLGCLELSAAHPDSIDPRVVRALVVADSAMVRRASYEVLFARHFRAADTAAVVELISAMLRDPSDQVRSSAISYIKRSDLLLEVLPLLRRWLSAAPELGWQDTDSHELASRLVEGGT